MDLRFYCAPDQPLPPGRIAGGVGVYLHGQAERDAGFDIPDSNRDLSTVPEGVHPAQVNDAPGYTLFLWRAPSMPILRGLVVKDADAVGVAYARDRFHAKPPLL